MARTCTREALILAAEKLIAENGLGAVSLRAINVAAGQRNASAVHYHFGSKDGLIRAIFERHMFRLNDLRVAMLDEVEANGRENDLHAIVEAVLLPLAAQLEYEPDGADYLGFLAQVYSSPSVRSRKILRDRYIEGVWRAYRLAEPALSHVPVEARLVRFELLLGYVLNALADYARARRRREAADRDFYVSNLVDTAAAALAAPVSSTTRGRLGAGRAGGSRSELQRWRGNFGSSGSKAGSRRSHKRKEVRS